MTVVMRLALRFAAIAMFLNMALTSGASAQDAMQRDQMFRDSLLRKTSPQEQAGPGLVDQDRRQDVGAVQAPIKVTRRHPWRH